MRIDPASNRVVGTTVTTGAPWCCGVAAGDEGVWLAAATSGTVAGIDPATGRAVVSTRPPAGPSAVGVGGGSVWVADDQARLVWRIDARTNQVLGSVAVSGIVITQGTTWPVMELTTARCGSFTPSRPRSRASLRTAEHHSEFVAWCNPGTKRSSRN